MSDFLESLSENFGWVVGTQLDYKKQFDIKKPLKRDVDSMADHAARTMVFTKSFRTEYWRKARIRRIAIVVLLLLLITNPSMKAFKEYKGRESYFGLSRPYNFLICSIYKVGQQYYLGIGENFILVLYY